MSAQSRRALALCVLATGLFGLSPSHTLASAEPLVIPSVPATAKRGMTIDDEIGKRYIKGVFLSPDRKRLLVQVYQADPRANVHRGAWFVGPVTEPGGFSYLADSGPIGLLEQTNGIRNGSTEGRLAAWSPDGRWIAFLRGDRQSAHIWRIRPDGSQAEQITQGRADIIELGWSADGKSILYTVSHDRAAVAEALRKEGLRGFVYSDDLLDTSYPSEFLNPCAKEREGFGAGTPMCQPKVWKVEIGRGEPEIASDEEAQAFRSLETKSSRQVGLQNGAEARSQDGNRVAWLANPDPTEFAGLAPPMGVFVSDRADKTGAMRCTYEECVGAISGPWWNASASEVIFLRREGHRRSVSTFYSWRPGGKLRRLWSGDSDFQHCSAADNRLICVRADWTHPGYVVAIDMKDGRTQTLFDPNPEFAQFEFTKVEKLEWVDANGNEALGHFVYPAGYQKGKRYPLAVVTYQFRGYMETVGDEHAVFPMAQEGFAVLYFSFAFDRKSFERIGDPIKALAANWKTSRAAALFWALEHLDERGLIDPTRIAVSGLSNGASFVDEAITSYPFAAASAAYSNKHPMSYYFLHRGQRESVRLISGGGSLPEQMPHLTLSSPGMNARKVVTPLLLNVADRELRSALANYALLQDAQRPVEMIVYPDEYHVKWQPAHRYNVYRRNMQWFQFWLQDKEADDPVDSQQYVRWRALRELRDKARQEDHTLMSCDLACAAKSVT